MQESLPHPLGERTQPRGLAEERAWDLTLVGPCSPSDPHQEMRCTHPKSRRPRGSQASLRRKQCQGWDGPSHPSSVCKPVSLPLRSVLQLLRGGASFYRDRALGGAPSAAPVAWDWSQPLVVGFGGHGTSTLACCRGARTSGGRGARLARQSCHPASRRHGPCTEATPLRSCPPKAPCRDPGVHLPPSTRHQRTHWPPLPLSPLSPLLQPSSLRLSLWPLPSAPQCWGDSVRGWRKPSCRGWSVRKWASGMMVRLRAPPGRPRAS